MTAIRAADNKVFVLPAIVSALFPAAAHGEPGLSGAYVPLLWLVVFVGAGICATVPLLVKRLVWPQGAGWVFWVASLVIGLLFLLFAGPVIVALGSIFITGRTM